MQIVGENQNDEIRHDAYSYLLNFHYELAIVTQTVFMQIKCFVKSAELFILLKSSNSKLPCLNDQRGINFNFKIKGKYFSLFNLDNLFHTSLSIKHPSVRNKGLYLLNNVIPRILQKLHTAVIILFIIILCSATITSVHHFLPALPLHVEKGDSILLSHDFLFAPSFPNLMVLINTNEYFTKKGERNHKSNIILLYSCFHNVKYFKSAHPLFD